MFTKVYQREAHAKIVPLHPECVRAVKAILEHEQPVILRAPGEFWKVFKLQIIMRFGHGEGLIQPKKYGLWR